MTLRVRLCGETLLEPGHTCAFFDSRDEKCAAIAPFFKDGIESGDRIINVVEAAAFDDHLASLNAASVPEQVLEYEARVNCFVPTFECTLLCVYDLAKTPATMVSDIMATHSMAIVKGRLRPNPYHVRPDEYLEMLKARKTA